MHAMNEETRVALEVDGRSLSVWPSSVVYELARDGALDAGRRRWVSDPVALQELCHQGWVLLGPPTAGGERLLFLPVAARRRFTCGRCGRADLPDWLVFTVGDQARESYCLHHVPRRVRLRLWLRGLVRRG